MSSICMDVVERQGLGKTWKEETELKFDRRSEGILTFPLGVRLGWSPPFQA